MIGFPTLLPTLLLFVGFLVGLWVVWLIIFDGCFCVMDVSVLTRLAGVSHGKTMYILRESSVFQGML